MTSRDTVTDLPADIQSAFGLLTRLPVPSPKSPRGPDAAWAWPLVGAAVGLLSAVSGAVALGFGLTPGVAAALALATSALVTGALHEDGLADTADGLFGGWTKERRLEIMKDSHIGSFGTLALVLVTLARWSALSSVLALGPAFGVLMAVGAVSRAPMAVLMHLMPNARGTGLSQTVGRPSRAAALAATALAVGVALVFTGTAAFSMVLLAGLSALALGRLAQARIGGQTGDILGAAQQLAEVAALAAAASLLGNS
jgi:adenosylcobinamide-GDP ribazoletransferase